MPANGNGITPKSFIVALLQILIVLMLVAAVAKPVLDFGIVAALEGLLGIAYLTVVFAWLRRETPGEFGKYALFFTGIWAAVQAAWLAQAFLMPGVAYLAIAGIVLALFAFIAVFGLVFGRRYTIGKVLLCDSELAAVETDFDLLSFTKGGRFVVGCGKGLKKGDVVKVEIRRAFWGRKPIKII